jgi:hypothetical protein
MPGVVEERPAVGGRFRAAVSGLDPWRRTSASRLLILVDQADSAPIFLAMADLRLAAWFLWMTPLLTALSS